MARRTMRESCVFGKGGVMPRVWVRELRDGDSVNEEFMLADKQLRANRNANLYLLTSLRDRTGAISGLMWNVSEDSVQDVSAGDFVRARGKVQLYQGGLQMIVTQLERVADGSCQADDFVVRPQADAAPLLERMKELLLSLQSGPLRTLAECFLADDPLMSALCAAPAGVKAHHAYPGGLIEHVVAMAELADRICQLYPALDRDLLLLGVLLHDLGKVRELTWDPTLAYSDEGQLLGHIHIATEILNEKLREAESRLQRPFETEQVLRLKHLILSHHGTLAFGSPVLPMTIEAIALHYIDNLDARMNEFTRSINDDPNGDSAWTPFSPRLERRLFKGHHRTPVQ
jgi:3'-5' exoribonuclease